MKKTDSGWIEKQDPRDFVGVVKARLAYNIFPDSNEVALVFVSEEGARCLIRIDPILWENTLRYGTTCETSVEMLKKSGVDCLSNIMGADADKT